MESRSHREVWFIRHGESVANAGGRTVEAATYPLSALGFRQAQQLATALTVEPELILVSPYLRARQTAEACIARFPDVPVEEWPVQEVQYLDPMLCVGTTQEERFAMAHEYWERCDPQHAAPNAESFMHFITRASNAIERLAALGERRVFVFCHGHFMNAVAWLMLTRPPVMDAAAMRHYYEFIHGFKVMNCAVLPLHFHADGGRSLGGLWVPQGVESEHTQREGVAAAGV